MAGKRGASSDLNHDNWDQDEEPEDSGTFQRASDDSLRKRVIKTAKRRNPISSVRESGDDGEKKSAFTNFSGFGKASASTSSSFSFLSNLTAPNIPTKVNGIEEKKETSTFTFNSKTTSSTSSPSETDKSSDKMLSWTQSEKTSSIFSVNTNNNPPSNASNDDKSNDYYSKLKGLNQSVSNWIKKHVDANPLINLQPIFKDYEKYFNELEKEKDLKSTQNLSTSETDKKGVVSPMSTFTFKPTASITDSTTEKTQSEPKQTESLAVKDTENSIPKFSFGTSVTTTGASSTVPSFSFGNNTGTSPFSLGTTTKDATKTTTSTTTSFTFGVMPTNPPSTIPTFSTSTPFRFANVAKPTSGEEENKETEEDDEPPKNEFTPVVEEDHVYTIRCKVFVKKDDKFGDRGVGNLFLKPVQDSEKFQLIVRADTNLGNLLLNFILSESIPIKRLGNKDVMLVCVPSPEVTPPPVPILLRVKSAEEADRLLETLNKYKK